MEVRCCQMSWGGIAAPETRRGSQRRKELIMKIRTILIASASLIAVGGVASADDHLFEALHTA